MDDAALFQTIRDRLFTAVLGDVMDTAGLRRQFLPPDIRAAAAGMVVVGRAMPVLEIDADQHQPWPAGIPAPFGFMLRALDGLRPGEVYVAAGGPGYAPDYALWGGLMTLKARTLGAAGAVLGGFHRDTPEILEHGLPVFSTGAYAQDQNGRGRVVDYRCRVTFGNGTTVEPGDLIVGDTDGVLAVPAAHVADVVQAALAKVDGESGVRGMIEAGMATEAIFAEVGIM